MASSPALAQESKINDVGTVLTHSAPLWNLPAHRPRCLEAMLYLEMASIKYLRKICKYNINYFVEELELPMLRYNMQTTRRVIDFCEDISNEQLNCHLELTHHADVSALQSLIRDRLHLVFLHQMYANQSNWNQYSHEMSHYLPLLLRRFLLKKERESVLKLLTKHQIITTKHAKELLIDCLHVIFMKMNGAKNSINDNNKIRYFFGSHPSSLDAVLVSEITLLACSQVPNKYLNDIKLKNDPKINYLLKYSKRIMRYYQESIISKLTPENQIEPIPILNEPKQFNKNVNKNKKTKTNPDRFYNKLLDTDEKKNSILFLAGSIAAFALYWRLFQPVRNS